MGKSDITIQGYHAHIYFRETTQETAEALHQMLGEMFQGRIKCHSIAYGPRGPHICSMFGIDIPIHELEFVLNFLIRNRGRHSILIHPVTGNELLDHTHNAMWLGTAQELDLSVLV